MPETSAIDGAGARERPSLLPVDAQPGKPLYATVKDALIRAIDDGHFPLDERLPSTKDLSEQMSVSLVTAHRALRELVGEGFLDRARGKGTFVVDRSSRAGKKIRVCVMIHRDVSLVDEHHSRLVEGMRQASANHHDGAVEIELTVSHYGGRLADAADGYLLLDPPESDLADLLAKTPNRSAKIVVGACPNSHEVPCIGVNSADLASLMIDHVVKLGHRDIGFLGTSRTAGGNCDIWARIEAACLERNLSIPPSRAIHVKGWRVDEPEKLKLLSMLDRADRPSVIIATGFHLSLDVYEAASTLGRNIPNDLSVIGIGNPASAAHLSPPLTCIHEPLVELGHAAVNAIVECISAPESNPFSSRTLRPELIIRQSVAHR